MHLFVKYQQYKICQPKNNGMEAKVEKKQSERESERKKGMKNEWKAINHWYTLGYEMVVAHMVPPARGSNLIPMKSYTNTKWNHYAIFIRKMVFYSATYNFPARS